MSACVFPSPVAEEAPPRVRVTAPVVAPWGAELPPCVQGCEPVVLRARASTSARSESAVFLPDNAVDRDPSTKWCGARGVGDVLGIALAQQMDVRRVTFVGDSSGGAVVTKVEVGTDRKDLFAVRMPKADSRSDASTWLVDLPGIKFLKIKLIEVSGDGPVCIREVTIQGTPVLTRRSHGTGERAR